MFDQGLQDRTGWEQWFNNLQGDYKTGAFYWAGQRSLPHPGSSQQMNADFYRGCTDAKVKLATTEALRKSEPGYKAGWNSYVAPITAPVMPSTPAPVAAPAPEPAPAPVAAPTSTSFEAAVSACTQLVVGSRSRISRHTSSMTAKDNNVRMFGTARARFDFAQCLNTFGQPVHY